MRAGTELPAPRGHKVWALLAYLLCAERAPSRDELATQLFPGAADPAGALRWNLSALRRAYEGLELTGDPVHARLPPGSTIDVATLAAGSWVEALAMKDLERELLEGYAFSDSPAFELWLLAQRRHLAGVAETVLREAALARLGAARATEAVGLAGRLVRLNPLDENYQALLVRCLAAAGDGVEAARQVARCRELFRRELGTEPSAALAEAGQAVLPSPTARPVSGRAAAAAQLEAGQAAITAGALDAGLQCLRRAVVDARGAGAVALQAQALLALGTALVHAARGRDEEAAAALHEALALGTEADLRPVAAAASRELGYVEFLRARYERSEEWLTRAGTLAADDPAELGRVKSVLGSALTDIAAYPRAHAELDESLELSDRAGDRRRTAYTLSMLGRLHLLRGDLEQATPALERSLELARTEGWTAFTPWPEALLAEVELTTGDFGDAADRFERAFALGCQLGDPCWEGIAARGLGLIAAEAGEITSALGWLTDARQRCGRLPDGYVWVEGYVLDALCRIAVAHDLPSAASWIEELAELATRTGMRDLAARAHLHRGRMGDASAFEAARMLGAGIESRALSGMLTALA